MKLLFDECSDRKFTREFVDYEAKTVPQMGWAGVKNGQLLALAEAEFDVFITVDRNLSFQQNLLQFNIAVIVLQASSNRLADLKALAAEVLAILATVAKGQATVVSTLSSSRHLQLSLWLCTHPGLSGITTKLTGRRSPLQLNRLYWCILVQRLVRLLATAPSESLLFYDHCKGYLRNKRLFSPYFSTPQQVDM
jgi:hypothetical protein